MCSVIYMCANVSVVPRVLSAHSPVCVCASCQRFYIGKLQYIILSSNVLPLIIVTGSKSQLCCQKMQKCRKQFFQLHLPYLSVPDLAWDHHHHQPPPLSRDQFSTYFQITNRRANITAVCILAHTKNRALCCRFVVIWPDSHWPPCCLMRLIIPTKYPMFLILHKTLLQALWNTPRETCIISLNPLLP